jgi:hypothetical protein
MVLDAHLPQHPHDEDEDVPSIFHFAAVTEDGRHVQGTSLRFNRRPVPTNTHSYAYVSQTSCSSGQHISPEQHAAMEDEPFNSSDIEFDDLPNPFSKAGARSIEAMLTSRHEDRVSSKKRLRQLQDTRGAPGTVEKRARWVNRLMSYIQMNESS